VLFQTALFALLRSSEPADAEMAASRHHADVRDGSEYEEAAKAPGGELDRPPARPDLLPGTKLPDKVPLALAAGWGSR